MPISYKKLCRIQDQSSWILTEHAPTIHSSSIQKSDDGVLALYLYHKTANKRLQNKVQKRLDEQFKTEVPIVWIISEMMRLETNND